MSVMLHSSCRGLFFCALIRLCAILRQVYNSYFFLRSYFTGRTFSIDFLSSAVFFTSHQQHPSHHIIYHILPSTRILLINPFKSFMYRSFFTILSVSLACYTVSSAAASADCLGQTEVPANQSRYPTDILVSNFTVSFPARLNRNLHVNASSTLNISTSHTADVLDTFGQVFNVSFIPVEYTLGEFNGTSNHTKDEDERKIHDSVAQRCYIGVVEKDCFDDIPTGTSVRACRPLTLTDDGSIDDPEDLADPVQTSATASTTTATPAPTATSKNSGAVNFVGQGDWRSSLLMVMIVTTVVRTGLYF